MLLAVASALTLSVVPSALINGFLGFRRISVSNTSCCRIASAVDKGVFVVINAFFVLVNALALLGFGCCRLLCFGKRLDCCNQVSSVQPVSRDECCGKCLNLLLLGVAACWLLVAGMLSNRVVLLAC